MPRGKTQKSLDFINACFRILEEIQPATIRAVAYQLFVRKLLDDMSKSSTNRVSTQLVYAREHGIVPWDWIVDETREEERVLVWDDIQECVEYTQANYRRDFWLEQPVRVGVWSEKGTVRGTLAPVLDAYQVPFLPTHGHNSATETRRLAARERRDSRLWVVLYVGDWDPSGMDMSERDLPERLRRYGASETFEIKRLAIVYSDLNSMERQGLTFDSRDKEVEAQRKHGVNTKKGKDTRRPWFEAEYGRRCCELDAMNPNELRERVEQAILAHINVPAWNHMVEVEKVECDSLKEIMQRWQNSISGQGHRIESSIAVTSLIDRFRQFRRSPCISATCDAQLFRPTALSRRSTQWHHPASILAQGPGTPRVRAGPIPPTPHSTSRTHVEPVDQGDSRGETRIMGV
jgi:hypothetical protein